MLRIGYMYQKSGGGDHRHVCGECLNFIEPEKDCKYKTCGLHPERPYDWISKWMACKFFRGEDAPDQEIKAITKDYLSGKATIAAAVGASVALAAARKENRAKEKPRQMTIDDFI